MADKYTRWVVKGTISEGGQARIYLVEDSSGDTKGQFALKRLKNIKRMDLFEREVEITRRLQHNNILRVIDFDLGATPYYVAELCERGSLEKIGATQYRGKIAEPVGVLLPVVSALQAAHNAGVVHRDVKPPNILLRTDGTPVLGDFGICHVEDDERITLSDEAMGSTNYIAPEMQAGQHGPVTGAADVYALGKVLYWMVSGGRIFARETHRTDNLYLPRLLGAQKWEHLHTLLDAMVAEDPARRPKIGDLAERLRDMVRLIDGDFMPLRPSMGLRCRVCGFGEYTKYATNQGWRRSAGWFNQIGSVSGTDLRVMRCDYCGHLEWFDFRDIKDSKWWER